MFGLIGLYWPYWAMRNDALSNSLRLRIVGIGLAIGTVSWTFVYYYVSGTFDLSSNSAPITRFP